VKITSLDKSISEILEVGYYLIPRFQRPFSWEKDQVVQFWEDLTADEETDYFIGSMVVFKGKNSSFGVVDGQQRLTTITMILCALRDAFSAQGLSDSAQGIHRFIEKPNIDNKKEYVLQTETSYPYLQEHIQKFGEPETQGEHGEEEQLLKVAFDIISGNVREMIEAVNKDPSISEERKKEEIREKLLRLRTKVLGLKVIHITLDDEDDAYVIFETLNTRGKDLSVADLLKNHLVKLIKPSNINVDISKETWEDIRNRMDKVQVKFDEFLYHHWLSKYERYVPIKKLFKSVKKQIRTNNAKEFLDELNFDSANYLKIIDPKGQTWDKNNYDIRDSLVAINIFRVKQPIPMILSLLREYEKGTLKYKHVKEALESIERFHFIFSAVTSQRSSGGISFMYAKSAINLSDAKKADDRIKVIRELKQEQSKKLPGYQEFEANFVEIGFSEKRDRQKKLVQYILAKLHKFYEPNVPIDFERMTIEHLASQKQTGTQALDEELVSRIGNLILLSEAANNKVGNKKFEEKKQILKKQKIWLDEVIENSNEWSKDKIEKRGKVLAKLAFQKIWKI